MPGKVDMEMASVNDKEVSSFDFMWDSRGGDWSGGSSWGDWSRRLQSLTGFGSLTYAEVLIDNVVHENRFQQLADEDEKELLLCGCCAEENKCSDNIVFRFGNYGSLDFRCQYDE